MVLTLLLITSCTRIMAAHLLTALVRTCVLRPNYRHAAGHPAETPTEHGPRGRNSTVALINCK
jgi:hypothetical protein